MRILFLHQNFPGQFLHTASALHAGGSHELLALIPTDNRRTPLLPVRHVRRYQWRSVRSMERNDLASTYADCASRGAAVADALLTLKAEGYTPDLVVGHGGWGETLFVRDVWRNVPVLLHAEFYYQGHGLDVGFDPETSDPDTRAPPGRRVRAVSLCCKP
jgi:hypothetical protein